MAELEVSAGQLIVVAGDLRSVADGLQVGLGGVDEHVSGLLGSAWIGEAGTAFSGVWRPWHEGAGKVLSGLNAMADLLEQAAHRYSTTDAAEAAAVDSAGL